ncbi:5-formyltetrahydrofolate cyclo-ligase [Pandoraea sp.]|uniref:5-formyltetrahydrofolate cyclo-ligase n=1 Tax=Pandoraea sp. TaxID=1883445 RepID=UPI0011F4FDB4|nr:5-formyltetrahydrofolate cyclo-ligase [Pandoraea sp.]TAL57333.1 MAG: 5-formyltetrahydrofolate cyclo-ligase [Pandoraea sp.]TAM16418.1 MAG: 5-formyltetrahydrofolate cyclo-ligase [Pandoraea sp.]
MAASIARDPIGEEPPTQAKATKTTLRSNLLAVRRELPDRPRRDAMLSERLADLLAREAPACVGFYWPILDEFDARPVIIEWLAQGSAGQRRLAALPVVTDPREPLVFHAWTPDSPMLEGYYRIPVPAHNQPLAPDLILIPCVGFNRQGYRLGYGGGFYDRTLAALDPRPRAVGIAFEATETPALKVQPHDVRLDIVLTESATLYSEAAEREA